jgi:hypothetical protein
MSTTQKMGDTIANHPANESGDLRIIDQVQDVADGPKIHAGNDETITGLEAMIHLLDTAVEQDEGALAVPIELGKELLTFFAGS